ncbi:MAG: hypothetical protein ACI4PV_07750 [Butyricicoccus sp.]
MNMKEHRFDLTNIPPLYPAMLALHRLALRFHCSEQFLQISEVLHQKFGLPALQPVRIRNR